LSTLPRQARISTNWKEEVNQRVAAHKNRKPGQVAAQDVAASQHAPNNRAAAAAARVAARFANAPSYSELLENEARAAVRAAEAVSRAALQAQAVAESVLAELQAAKAAQPEWQFHVDDEPVQTQHRDHTIDELPSDSVAGQLDFEQDARDQQTGNGRSYEIRWEPDAPMLHPNSAAPSAQRKSPEWQENAWSAPEEAVEIVEPDQPIHANLIEFPKEIVATRKVRPRRVEGPFAAQDQDVQLSIFEVEPEAISTDPVAADAMNPAAAPSWMTPEWSGMELDEHPVRALQDEVLPDLREELIYDSIIQPEIEQAPFTLRLMAAVVDGSLVLAAFLAVTLEIVSRLHALPGARAAELGAAAGLLIMSALYLALCYAVGGATPGMRYARIALCTFEGEVPARRIRFQRLAAVVLSVLPMGVGVLWSIFDEAQLSWHDRLSGTYLRAY
jgi:uncharacterized RDD family membrane protein YckC